MSKKNKRKFYSSQPSSSVSAEVTTTSAGTPSNAAMGDAHTEEYRVIKNDLLKVVILNAVFLAGVLTLYYTNLNSHYLEKWFSTVFKF